MDIAGTAVVAKIKHMQRVLSLAALMAFTNSALAAEKIPCAPSNKNVVAACFPVHGRVSVYTGAIGMRMWKIGTTRMLGVYDGNFEDEAEEGQPQPELLPPNAKRLVEAQEVRSDFDLGGAFLFGDFEVCPLTAERAGWMQMVCIKEARNLVLRRNQ